MEIEARHIVALLFIIAFVWFIARNTKRTVTTTVKTTFKYGHGHPFDSTKHWIYNHLGNLNIASALIGSNYQAIVDLLKSCMNIPTTIKEAGNRQARVKATHLYGKSWDGEEVGITLHGDGVFDSVKRFQCFGMDDELNYVPKPELRVDRPALDLILTPTRLKSGFIKIVVQEDSGMVHELTYIIEGRPAGESGKMVARVVRLDAGNGISISSTRYS